MDTLKSAVQKTVNEMYQNHGEVRPSELVERSAPKDSPTHDAFEWDNKKAGHEYRLIQARQWIRKVEIVFDDRTERLIHVPLVKIEGAPNLEGAGGENYYKPVSDLVADPDEFDRALSETLARLNSAKAAYSQLKQAAKPDQVNFTRADRGFKMVEHELRKARP